MAASLFHFNRQLPSARYRRGLVGASPTSLLSAFARSFRAETIQAIFATFPPVLVYCFQRRVLAGFPFQRDIPWTI
jgi:hypothetical protein